MIRNNFFFAGYSKDFEIWVFLLRIDAKLCSTSDAPILQTFMEAQWLREFSLFKYHKSISYDSTISIDSRLIESVLLTKVHVESQIVCPKMHQRGNVKNGNMGIGKKGRPNMGIGKSLNQCMRVIWAI